MPIPVEMSLISDDCFHLEGYTEPIAIKAMMSRCPLSMYANAPRRQRPRLFRDDQGSALCGLIAVRTTRSRRLHRWKKRRAHHLLQLECR